MGDRLGTPGALELFYFFNLRWICRGCKQQDDDLQQQEKRTRKKKKRKKKHILDASVSFSTGVVSMQPLKKNKKTFTRLLIRASRYKYKQQ